MRRSLKYTVTMAFILLMGYSQLFTYAYLGACSVPAARIADGILHFQAPLVRTNIFEQAIIEEIEESKTDRDGLNIPARAHDAVTAQFLSIRRGESFNGRTIRPADSDFNTLSDNSFIRFRVFRL